MGCEIELLRKPVWEDGGLRGINAEIIAAGLGMGANEAAMNG